MLMSTIEGQTNSEWICWSLVIPHSEFAVWNKK